MLGAPARRFCSSFSSAFGFWVFWFWLVLLAPAPVCAERAVVCLIAMLYGELPVLVTPTLPLHVAGTLQALLWLQILSIHHAEVRETALRARGEAERLFDLAHRDPLTGLLNRRGLDRMLVAQLPAGHAPRAMAIFLTDLDGFKAVNDQLGHDAGDALLRGVAERLKHELRQEDRVARLGGDEFVLVASGLRTEADAEALAGKLLKAIRVPFDVGDGRVAHVGLTLGYVLVPEDGRELDALLKRADAAMYEGKQAGKNCARRWRANPGALAEQS
jgi:diguanylate cyclase